MLTAGGLAPCLSSSVAALTQQWVAALRAGKISGLTLRMYKDGYKGLLQGDSFVVPEEVWDAVAPLHDLGGSPIGNSRVKVRSGFQKESEILKGIFFGLIVINDGRCYRRCNFTPSECLLRLIR